MPRLSIQCVSDLPQKLRRGEWFLHERQYSMPPNAIGLPGTLYLYRDRVRIVAGRQLWEWLTEANTVRPSRATGVRPGSRRSARGCAR
jgi:hypothetical protein